MPDITMCADHDCPYCRECYRHEAEPSPVWQSYFLESPREGDVCEMYIPIVPDAA